LAQARQRSACGTLAEVAGLPALRRLAAASLASTIRCTQTAVNGYRCWARDVGRREEALAAIEEAVGILRPLAAAQPRAFLPKLADVLHTQSDRLRDLGRQQEAQAVIEQAMDIDRQLAKAHPAKGF
jgi:tetratricopeptide (TPR) repeat protein